MRAQTQPKTPILILLLENATLYAEAMSRIMDYNTFITTFTYYPSEYHNLHYSQVRITTLQNLEATRTVGCRYFWFPNRGKSLSYPRGFFCKRGFPMASAFRCRKCHAKTVQEHNYGKGFGPVCCTHVIDEKVLLHRTRNQPETSWSDIRSPVPTGQPATSDFRIHVLDYCI